MKKSGKITAVLLSAAIAASFSGMTAYGDADIIENVGSSCVMEADASVYNITKGKSKTFSLKMKNVKQLAAISTDNSVAKVTSISRKNDTVKVTVKGVSAGTATIKVYDKKNKKNYKTVKVRVKAASSDSSSSNSSQSSSDKENVTITVVYYNGQYYVVESTGDENGSDNAASSGSSGSSGSEKSDVDDYVKGVFDIVNEERTSRGLEPLTLNETLCEAAAERAKEVGEYFSHTRPDGTDCFTVLDEYKVSGYYTAGENIAQGQRDPEQVMNSWMNSPGHKANILNESFSGIGIGYDPATRSWVQLFIG